MSIQKKARLLHWHGIEHTFQDHRLMAIDLSVSDGCLQAVWVDVTHYDIFQWLGY